MLPRNQADLSLKPADFVDFRKLLKEKKTANLERAMANLRYKRELERNAQPADPSANLIQPVSTSLIQ